jgi:hypothetical protein
LSAEDISGLLRRILDLRRGVRGGRSKSYKEVNHNTFSSPNIIRMMKSRRMKLAGM